MFRRKSREDVLRIWLRAAEEFAQSPTPHVGVFADITGQANREVTRNEGLLIAKHVAEEIAGARAQTNPDKVDAVFLQARFTTTLVWGDSDELLDECVRDGIVKDAAEKKQRLDAISGAIRRRRSAMGIKGRRYYFD